MKSGGALRHFLVAFGIALVAYVAFYRCDHHLRVRKGPWEVTFTANPAGAPVLVVNQPGLAISNVLIVLHDETAPGSGLPTTVRFDRPRRDMPFGKVIYDDLMYLPGAVTLELFGHEVELLPRTLLVNRKPVPWAENLKIELTPKDRLPAPPKAPR
jgi:hypothetical protein